jgi:hypothetical protein
MSRFTNCFTMVTDRRRPRCDSKRRMDSEAICGRCESLTDFEDCWRERSPRIRSCGCSWLPRWPLGSLNSAGRLLRAFERYFPIQQVQWLSSAEQESAQTHLCRPLPLVQVALTVRIVKNAGATSAASFKRSLPAERK